MSMILPDLYVSVTPLVIDRVAGMLQSMESQRVEHERVTELN